MKTIQRNELRNQASHWAVACRAALTVALMGALLPQAFAQQGERDVTEVFESEPKHVEFRSAPFFGAVSELQVSYLRGKRLIPGESRSFLSKDVVVTLSNPSFSGDEWASGVFMNVCTDRRTGEENYQDVIWADLEWSGSAFESKAYEIVFDHTDSSGSRECRQELAAVVNGYWMTDPVNGTHNFEYLMRDAD